MVRKSLPPAILKPTNLTFDFDDSNNNQKGILLGDKCYWNPSVLPNGHVAIIGTSGSGKTQTLKALAYDLPSLFPDIKRIIIDYHGDQEIPGEKCFTLSMNSPHGINPLVIDQDVKGGGPALQAIAVAASLRKSLLMGANQEGLIIDILSKLYRSKGIIQGDNKTWNNDPPTFHDMRKEIESRIQSGCKDSLKLALKLAATFEYGIFTKPQKIDNFPLIRIDLSALGKVVGLSAIATEAIIKQIMDSHRIMGESKMPRTYLFIDECKEVRNSRTLNIILEDGRKYGLSCVVASQRDAEISKEIVANTATKIVLSVDQTEVKNVARRFRFSETVVAALKPLEALVRMGNNGIKTNIIPYYRRVL